MECTYEDMTIHYEACGDADGLPLVMIHGFPADHHICLFTMEPAFHERKGWWRVYVDLPGTGRSPAVERIDTHDKLLQALLGFIDHVLPGRRFAVGGFSWGGYWSRAIAHEWAGRVIGQVLIAPDMHTANDEKYWPRHVTLAEDPALLAGLDPNLARDFRSVAVVQTRELLDVLQRGILEPAARANQAFFDRLWRDPGLSFHPDDLPAPFAAPTLIVTGRQDSMAGYHEAGQILDRYLRATYAVLDRAGHGLAFEQRGLFNALVGEWLDRVEEYIH